MKRRDRPGRSPVLPTGVDVARGSEIVVEWVEVRGKTVDVAVAAAMQELAIADREGVDVEVIQEPEKGFLGMGGKDAIVRVKPRPQGRNRKRRRGRGEGEGDRRPGPGSSQGSRPPDRAQGDRGEGSRGGTRSGSGQGGRGRSQARPPQGQDQRSSRPPRPSGDDRSQRPSSRPENDRHRERANRERSAGPPREREARVSTANPHEQAPMVEEFLNGLVASFGLDGQVNVSVEDEVIVATINGEQTEALVGPRGSVMEAIHEITKTVLHRQVDDTARVRIDIAGYAERRRQALSIYATQLIDQVLGEGGEIMLEPMSAADRKVIHDAVAEREGVRSYSEGEPPRRYVVIATTDEAAEDDDED
ncbi:MAG TPA: RNA-binding cell elongation regulator Jag/EloR [Acidimicrobiia bacterium]|nr:RNA-binding cell elongation regulator Jag/EloR [Acidimicrobiia bacterium]